MTRLLTFLVLILVGSVPTEAQPVYVDGLPRTTFYTFAARGDTLMAGADTVVYVSTDRGQTWTPTARVAATVWSVDALALTDAGWFAASFGVGVFRSTDHGQSWTSLSHGLTDFGARYVTDFETRGDVLYAGTHAGVYALDLRTPTVWQSVSPIFGESAAATINAIARQGEQLVVAAGGNGLVFTQADAAAPWTSAVLTPVFPGPMALDVEVLGPSLVVATTGGSFRSDDGGAIWYRTGTVLRRGFDARIATEGDLAFLSISFAEGVSDLYWSNDHAATWTHVGVVNEVLQLAAYDGTVYIAHLDGVQTWTPPTVDDEPSAPRPTGLRLDPVAPNPAVGSTTFRFWLDRAEAVRLEVFDVLGRPVAVVYDGVAPSGTTTVRWDASRQAPGLYVVRLIGPRGAQTRAVVVAR